MKGAGSEKFNVMRHYLVPKMEILSKTEVAKVLKKYGVTKDRLPKMRADDPEAIALGAKPGDIIKIYRKDPTAEYVYYRVVIDAE